MDNSDWCLDKLVWVSWDFIVLVHVNHNKRLRFTRVLIMICTWSGLS